MNNVTIIHPHNGYLYSQPSLLKQKKTSVMGKRIFLINTEFKIITKESPLKINFVSKFYDKSYMWKPINRKNTYTHDDSYMYIYTYE